MTYRKERAREEFVIVLDFLPHGHPFEGKRIPVAQAIGKEHLLLLEVVPKRNETLKALEEVYIGSKKREKVHHVIGNINYSKLTSTAKLNFDKAVEKIIDENPQKWVDFFNNARSISIRLHQLEVLPGIGKKHQKEILEERENGPFKSFEDISERISLLPNPKEIIIKRIKMELDDVDKYRLFVR